MVIYLEPVVHGAIYRPTVMGKCCLWVVLPYSVRILVVPVLFFQICVNLGGICLGQTLKDRVSRSPAAIVQA